VNTVATDKKCKFVNGNFVINLQFLSTFTIFLKIFKVRRHVMIFILAQCIPVVFLIQSEMNM
jgi:hypothetical protein